MTKTVQEWRNIEGCHVLIITYTGATGTWKSIVVGKTLEKGGK